MYPVDNMNLLSALTKNLYNLSLCRRHYFNRVAYVLFTRLENRKKYSGFFFPLNSVAFETSVGKFKKKNAADEIIYSECCWLL